MVQGTAQRNGKRLSAALVRTVREPGKYHDGGGLGLYLRVDPNGARYWVQRIAIRGKRRELGLGSPPLVSLAEAREQASENKRLTRTGGDPLAEKRKGRGGVNFSEAMDLYLAGKLHEFQNEKHRKQWRSTLDTYAAPMIGAIPVQDVHMRDVLRVLEPIWREKTETASRLRGRIEAVLSWATVAGHREGDNPARWRGNLSEMLPKPGKLAKGENHPALPIAVLPRWWAHLAEREGMAARALQFLTLCAARSGEVRGLTWNELDLVHEGDATRAMWTIPASRMKAGREHRVPLTAEASALLQGLPRMEGSQYVFFAPSGGMLSDMTLSAVMRRMQEAEEMRLANADKAAGREPSGEPRGYIDPRSMRPAVPHGLRSSFRDWAAEQGFDRDMAELQLAHNVGSEVERAYRRSDMLERRRAMLEDWARFLRGENLGATVVALRP